MFVVVCDGSPDTQIHWHCFHISAPVGQTTTIAVHQYLAVSASLFVLG